MTRTREVTRIPRAEHTRMRWKNGAGFTTELALRPAGAGGEFDWRLSIAEVEVDCEFSRFPGVDRSILVLSGGGFTLHVDDEAPVRLHVGGPSFSFAGERVVRCVVGEGPTRDFNVMTRRACFTHTLARSTLAGTQTLERAAGVSWATYVAIYVEAGEVHVGSEGAETGDCVLVEPGPADRPPLELRGEARLVLVRFGPAAR